MVDRFLNLSLIGSIALLASAPALASGSGGGGYVSGGGGYSQPSTARDPYADAYARGKSQFRKRIACKTCAFPQGVHDSVTAGMITKRVRSGEFRLTEQQRSDLMIFLQQRYGVPS
jgi:hypothetical protein